jgi:hypothetical protein
MAMWEVNAPSRKRRKLMRERYEGSLREKVLALRTARRARWRHLLYVRACIDLNSS